MRRSSFLLMGVGFALALSSCRTPQEKLNRLVKKYPNLERDTVLTDYDTTIVNIPAVHADSVIHINTIKTDTFVMTKEHLRVQTIFRNDSIFIEGDCYGITDTIISVEEIRTKYVVSKDERGISFQWLLICILATVMVTRFLTVNRSKIYQYIKKEPQE